MNVNIAGSLRLDLNRLQKEDSPDRTALALKQWNTTSKSLRLTAGNESVGPLINSARENNDKNINSQLKRTSTNSKILEGSEIMHLNILEDTSKPSPQNSDSEIFKFKSNSIFEGKRIRALLQSPDVELIHIENQRNSFMAGSELETVKHLPRQIDEAIKIKHRPRMSMIDDTNEENVSSDGESKETQKEANESSYVR